ncbi:MAG: hypothetical protein LBJ31_00605 [Treponema sp.]|nr:hypothetical protein [Treponema sp.]
MVRKITVLLIFLILQAGVLFAQTGDLFLYVPSEEIMREYMGMHTYLEQWDNDKIQLDNERLARIFTGFVGEDTLQGLLVESFLRNTKNKTIQNQVVNYINKNRINTGFAAALKKLYAAVPVIHDEDGRQVTQYVYNKSQYEENIDLFSFNEVEFLNGELGMLLFDNKWGVITFEGEGGFSTLIYGGGTNSITLRFNKYPRIQEKDVESTASFSGENWRTFEPPLEGILARSGADRIIAGYRIGPGMIESIDEGTFTVYLYNKKSRNLYEVTYYMNFSAANINYTERTRIYNFLLFQLLFVFIQ